METLTTLALSFLSVTEVQFLTLFFFFLPLRPIDLLQRLKEEGYTQLWTPPQNLKNFNEKSFFLDNHCSDVLTFSLDCNTLLQEHPLVEEGFLVRQVSEISQVRSGE